MNSRKKRTRIPRPSLREASDQAELAALVHSPEPSAKVADEALQGYQVDAVA